MQDFGFEMFAQYRIDTLLTLHATEAVEGRTDDERFEMTTIAIHGQVLASETGTNPVLDLTGIKHEEEASG
jgi:hypothetical protein